MGTNVQGNILNKPVLGFLLLKSLSGGVAVCTKQPVANSYRKNPRKKQEIKGQSSGQIQNLGSCATTEDSVQYPGLLDLEDNVIPTAASACRNTAQQR